MQLSDFPFIQSARKAFEHFFSSPNSIGINTSALDDNEGGTVLAIKLKLPRVRESYLNIGHNPHGTVHKAVNEAVSEWMKTKREEIAQIAIQAAKQAEISAAKELQADAINILTVANQ
jgi:hypothetical protein